MNKMSCCVWFIISVLSTGIYGNSCHGQVETLAHELFDVSKHPEKSFASYMDDLIKILKPVEQAKVFCQKMEGLKNSKNGMIVGVTFIQYRKLFSDELIKLAITLGKDKLMEVFRFRTNPRSK